MALDEDSAIAGRAYSRAQIIADTRHAVNRRCPQWFPAGSEPERSGGNLGVRRQPHPDTDWNRNTFITSSPRRLMTLTAMRPEAGLGNGREVSLCKVAQASSSISAFRVVFSAL